MGSYIDRLFYEEDYEDFFNSNGMKYICPKCYSGYTKIDMRTKRDMKTILDGANYIKNNWQYINSNFAKISRRVSYSEVRELEEKEQKKYQNVFIVTGDYKYDAYNSQSTITMEYSINDEEYINYVRGEKSVFDRLTTSPKCPSCGAFISSPKTVLQMKSILEEEVNKYVNNELETLNCFERKQSIKDQPIEKEELKQLLSNLLELHRNIYKYKSLLTSELERYKAYDLFSNYYFLTKNNKLNQIKDGTYEDEVKIARRLINKPINQWEESEVQRLHSLFFRIGIKSNKLVIPRAKYTSEVLRPTAPIKKQLLSVDKKLLIQPVAPKYQKLGLFGRKRKQEENDRLKEIYEKSYNLYLEEQKKNRINLRNEEEYTALLDEYKDQLEMYNDYCKETKKYNKELDEFIDKVVNPFTKLVEQIEKNQQEYIKKFEDLESYNSDEKKIFYYGLNELFSSASETNWDNFTMGGHLGILFSYFYLQYIVKIKKILETLYSCLNKIVDQGYIYSKYCYDYVAIATILEYFKSGRVNALTGTNGAYNLLESEKSNQNFISTLDNIDKNIEKMKTYQYVLYESVKPTLDEIQLSVKNIDTTIVRISRDFSSVYYTDNAFSPFENNEKYLEFIKSLDEEYKTILDLTKKIDSDLNS